MHLSTYWAQRSKLAFGKNLQKGLFGIVQGGIFSDLRIKSLNLPASNAALTIYIVS